MRPAAQRPYVIHCMEADRVSRIVAQYEAGAITEGSACLAVLMAAGEGDAEAIFVSLPPWLRDAVARDIADANPGEARIVESYCGTASDKEYAADLRRREEIMRRGIVALQRVTSGRTGGG
jgi:hypothetical protein